MDQPGIRQNESGRASFIWPAAGVTLHAFAAANAAFVATNAALMAANRAFIAASAAFASTSDLPWYQSSGAFAAVNAAFIATNAAFVATKHLPLIQSDRPLSNLLTRLSLCGSIICNLPPKILSPDFRADVVRHDNRALIKSPRCPAIKAFDHEVFRKLQKRRPFKDRRRCSTAHLLRQQGLPILDPCFRETYNLKRRSSPFLRVFRAYSPWLLNCG